VADIADRKIALLIDAENAQAVSIPAVLAELSAHGRVLVRRAYGDWSRLNGDWPKTLNQLSISAIQQHSLTAGKNAADIALVIDAMDLFYKGVFDAFALVTSDSDFTRLASRLREGEMHVLGFGKGSTPEAFRRSCDDFIDVGLLVQDAADTTRADELIQREFVATLRDLSEKSQQDGWVDLSQAASVIKRMRPDFSPSLFGCKKFSDVLAQFSAQFEVVSIARGNGVALQVRAKPRKADKKTLATAS